MDRAHGRVRRSAMRVAMVAVPIAVLAPAVTGDDSFPLSTYPMYAFTRPRVETFVGVMAEQRDGTRRPVSSSLTAGSSDPLIAEAVVEQAIAADGGAQLCRHVAAKVDPSVISVSVVEQSHDIVAWAQHRPSRRGEVVHHRCEVAP